MLFVCLDLSLFNWLFQGRQSNTALQIQSNVHLIEVLNNRNYWNKIHFSVRVRLIEVSAE